MVARHFYRNDDGDMEEIDFVPREGWEVKEGAEEGSSESSTISIPDPDSMLGFVPHRRYIIYEDTSESADQVIFSGFVTSDDTGREGGEHLELVADSRVITITVNDMNTLFEQRVMTGSDADRAEESDVDRLTDIANSEEMGYFDDLSLLSSDDPETMEARDCTGQTPKQLFDECAQDTDKNYWIGATGDVIAGTDIFLWYGVAGLSAYASPLSLSNDPADFIDADLADGTATTWPISEDTQRHQTGERIYSGVLVEYEGGRVYRKSAATMAAFTLSGRDLVHPAPEIKSSARAARRANRLLASLNEPEITVTTRVRLPAAKGTMLRAGMLVDIKATHIPELALTATCRILNASIKPVQAGAYYDITIEAVPVTGATVEVIHDAALGSTVTQDWSSAPTDGQLMVSIVGIRGTHDSAHAVTSPAWTYLGYAESGSFSMEADWRLAGAGESATFSAWAGLGGSSAPEVITARFTGADTVEGPYTGSGTNDTTMSITGITSTGAGLLLVGFQVHNFDIPPHTLTPPAGFTVLHDAYRDFAAGLDWVWMAYKAVDSCPSSLTWTASNTFFDWYWQAVAVFIPGDF